MSRSPAYRRGEREVTLGRNGQLEVRGAWALIGELKKAHADSIRKAGECSEWERSYWMQDAASTMRLVEHNRRRFMDRHHGRIVRPLPEPCRFAVPCSEIGGSRCRPCFECCDRGDAR